MHSVSCVITAFKTDAEYKSTNVMTLPQSWLNFDNFVKAFTKANMLVAFRNSLIVLVVVLAVSIIIGTQLAYVLNRFKFPGNGLIRNAFTFAALLPAVAMQVAVYEIIHYHDVWYRCYLHLYFHPVFREPAGFPG